MASIVLHAVTLSYLQPAWDQSRRGDRQGVIEATLRPTSEPAERLVANAAPSITNAQALPLTRKIALRPSPAVDVRHDFERQLGVNVNAAANQGARQLGALLVIDAAGRVGPIHWKQLPPMTDDALRRLEQRLRQKSYPAIGVEYTVIEVLDNSREVEPHR